MPPLQRRGLGLNIRQMTPPPSEEEAAPATPVPAPEPPEQAEAVPAETPAAARRVDVPGGGDSERKQEAFEIEQARVEAEHREDQAPERPAAPATSADSTGADAE